MSKEATRPFGLDDEFNKKQETRNKKQETRNRPSETFGGRGKEL
jgi:hypothetical protein